MLWLQFSTTFWSPWGSADQCIVGHLFLSFSYGIFSVLPEIVCSIQPSKDLFYNPCGQDFLHHRLIRYRSIVAGDCSSFGNFLDQGGFLLPFSLSVMLFLFLCFILKLFCFLCCWSVLVYSLLTCSYFFRYFERSCFIWPHPTIFWVSFLSPICFDLFHQVIFSDFSAILFCSFDRNILWVFFLP